jgi:hypothetical protein
MHASHIAGSDKVGILCEVSGSVEQAKTEDDVMSGNSFTIGFLSRLSFVKRAPLDRGLGLWASNCP